MRMYLEMSLNCNWKLRNLKSLSHNLKVFSPIFVKTDPLGISNSILCLFFSK